jgi:cell division protein FtsQ
VPVVSAQSAERFAERARARRHVAVRKAALTAGGLLLVVLLGWVALFSPVAALDPAKVRVQGAGELVPTAQLDQLVTAQAGVPLARLDTVALRERLLAVPGVKDIRVMRDWPDGLIVTVVSRAPVAAVPVTDGSGGLSLLDADGVTLGHADAAPAGIPVVAVPAGQPRTLAAVLGVLHALPADLAAEVASVSATTQDTVQLTLADGVKVEWGSAEDNALKAAVLRTIRAAPSVSGTRVIDVSAPSMPVLR